MNIHKITSQIVLVRWPNVRSCWIIFGQWTLSRHLQTSIFFKWSSTVKDEFKLFVEVQLDAESIPPSWWIHKCFASSMSTIMIRRFNAGKMNAPSRNLWDACCYKSGSIELFISHILEVMCDKRALLNSQGSETFQLRFSLLRPKLAYIKFGEFRSQFSISFW